MRRLRYREAKPPVQGPTEAGFKPAGLTPKSGLSLLSLDAPPPPGQPALSTPNPQSLANQIPSSPPFSVTPQIYNQQHKTLQLGGGWRTGPPATHPPGFLRCKLISKGQRVGRFLKGPDLSGCETVEEGCQAVFPTLRERQTSGPTLIFDQRLLAQRVLLAEKSLYGVLVLNRTACFNYQSHNPLHCQFV